MNRMTAFADRNQKEILRDPLSYIFCLAFPLAMLVVMTLVNSSIPKESGMTVFRIDNLAVGIAVFGQTFIMLFTGLTVSKDRSGSFLVRMYATPMESSDFTMGYMLPMLVIALAQNVLIYLGSILISFITGPALNPLGLLASMITLIPSAILYICIGLLFGTLFSEKAAPGLCSIIISLSSFVGGVWFDPDNAGGVMLTICRLLPFYYCTRSGRSAVRLDFGTDTWVIPFLIVVLCAAALAVLASVVFRSKMKADLS